MSIKKLVNEVDILILLLVLPFKLLNLLHKFISKCIQFFIKFFSQFIFDVLQSIQKIWTRVLFASRSIHLL